MERIVQMAGEGEEDLCQVGQVEEGIKVEER